MRVFTLQALGSTWDVFLNEPKSHHDYQTSPLHTSIYNFTTLLTIVVQDRGTAPSEGLQPHDQSNDQSKDGR